MTQHGILSAQKVGVVRIFLSAGDRRPGLSWRQRLFSRPLYQEIIDLARERGLWGATALGLTYGFTDEGKATASFHPDAGFTNMHIYVELIAPRTQLEAFITQIVPLIPSRVVTFAEFEHWGEGRAAFDAPDRVAA
jgi:PII-like signaling protein